MTTNNIRTIRETQGISRVDLAFMSGVSEPMLKVLESGEYDIMKSKLETLVKIATALRVCVRDLLPKDKRFLL